MVMRAYIMHGRERVKVRGRRVLDALRPMPISALITRKARAGERERASDTDERASEREREQTTCEQLHIRSLESSVDTAGPRNDDSIKQKNAENPFEQIAVKMRQHVQHVCRAHDDDDDHHADALCGRIRHGACMCERVAQRSCMRSTECLTWRRRHAPTIKT